jgi:hypothetical protein
LTNVLDENLGPANGSDLGRLRLIIRATQDDPTDLTAVDHTAEFPLRAAAGNVKFVTPIPTLATTITVNSLQRLPPPPIAGPPLSVVPCSSLEIKRVELLDGAGNIFAVGGVYVPNLSPYQPTSGGPQCEYQHPRKAVNIELGLVQAFTECATPGTSTSTGVAACAPPETVNDSAGDPPNGWHWDSPHSFGTVQFKRLNYQGGANGIGANGELVPNNTGDVAITAKLGGILGSGTGTLKMLWRVTLADRRHGDMTMIDVPLETSFTLSLGKGVVKTTLDTILNAVGLQDLPGCTTAQLVELSIEDVNGNTFAVPGLRTK